MSESETASNCESDYGIDYETLDDLEVIDFDE